MSTSSPVVATMIIGLSLTRSALAPSHQVTLFALFEAHHFKSQNSVEPGLTYCLASL